VAYFPNGTSGGLWEDCNCGKGRIYHEINPTYDVDISISTQEAFEAQYIKAG